MRQQFFAQSLSCEKKEKTVVTTMKQLFRLKILRIAYSLKKNLCQADMLTAYCADNEIDVKYIRGNDVYL